MFIGRGRQVLVALALVGGAVWAVPAAVPTAGADGVGTAAANVQQAQDQLEALLNLSLIHI